MINPETLDNFNKIYDETYKYTLEYIVCNACNVDDVEDIIQDTYYSVYRALVKMKKKELTRAYVLGIAKNKIKDYYRFKYKQKIISLYNESEEKDYIDAIPTDEDIENEIIKTDNLNIIWNFLKKKKAVVGKIFFLYYNLDYKIKDIALKLNLTESNVKHYLYRTLKELNSYIEGEGIKNDGL